MAEFKSISLATQVFEKLEEDIITGVYPRGEILTELKLVEQLGVSRTPIREALRRLEQERLIAESGKGSVVLGITMEDLVDIMDIRQRIEGLAAYYATKNLTTEGRERLRQISELQDFFFGGIYFIFGQIGREAVLHGAVLADLAHFVQNQALTLLVQLTGRHRGAVLLGVGHIIHGTVQIQQICPQNTYHLY